MGLPQSLLLLTLHLSSILTSSTDYSALVFKGCVDQNFQNSSALYSETLRTLFDTFISQSSYAKFYKRRQATGHQPLSTASSNVSDISGCDCSCVKKAPNLAQKLCGQAITTRVQLNGCYLQYEISKFRQVSGVELLYKICGLNWASGVGFGDRLDLTLGEIVKRVGSDDRGSTSAPMNQCT